MSKLKSRRVVAGSGRRGRIQPRRRRIKEPSSERKDFIRKLADNTYLLVDLTEEDLKWIDGVEGYDVFIREVFEEIGFNFDEFRSYLRPGVCAVPSVFAQEFYEIQDTLILTARDWTRKGNEKDERLALKWLTLAAKLENARSTTPPQPWDRPYFGWSGQLNWNNIVQDEWIRRPRSRAEEFEGERTEASDSSGTAPETSGQ
jgi:hypothetical protein